MFSGGSLAGSSGSGGGSGSGNKAPPFHRPVLAQQSIEMLVRLNTCTTLTRSHKTVPHIVSDTFNLKVG